MKTKPILKLLTLCVLPAALVLPAFAQMPVAYNFTVTKAHDGTSITLTNVYIIDVEAGEAYAFITSIVGLQGQTSWSSGSQIAGTIPGNAYAAANNLILIAMYTDTQDATNGVAISLPTSLATNYFSSGETWNQSNNSTNFPFLLPNEATTLSDLQSLATMQFFTYQYFNYLPSGDPIVQLYGQDGIIVAFSSAQSIGSFSFVPQPALRISSGGGNVTVQWPTNSPGFTLAQSTNLSAGAWSDVTAVKTVIKTNYSVTLPAGTTNQFFQLHWP
jgi:hypothetical protein